MVLTLEDHREGVFWSAEGYGKTWCLIDGCRTRMVHRPRSPYAIQRPEVVVIVTGVPVKALKVVEEL